MTATGSQWPRALTQKDAQSQASNKTAIEMIAVSFVATKTAPDVAARYKYSAWSVSSH